MSETIKLCAMLARAVFENDDEAREPFVEQAMRAKREHDEMRRELAEARRAVDNIGDAYDRLVSAVVGGVASAAYCFDTSEYEKQAERLRADIEQADTTRREWEVRAATSYAAGRKVGLQAYDSGRWDGLCAAAELALNWGGASWNLSRAIRALANDGSVKLARMLDEAHATGRAAGLREAAAACVDVVRLDFPTGGTVENVVAMVVNRCMDRILAALAPPAAECHCTELSHPCDWCTSGALAAPERPKCDQCGRSVAAPEDCGHSEYCDCDGCTLRCHGRGSVGCVRYAAEPRDEGES